jgi:cytoskeletal protein RodZ
VCAATRSCVTRRSHAGRVRHFSYGRASGTVIEIGASLAQARVRLGIEFEEAAKATRLRAYYLRALETEEFDLLPPGSYRRAFLRTYASFLALDADLLVGEYAARWERREHRHTAVPLPVPLRRARRRLRRPG